MKVYAGAPAAARHYVEADRGRADDYYLAEGTGIARRFTAGEGEVTELAPLTGDAYQAWVAGHDADTGEPRGRLRRDDRAVRFVEVVVNGPKSWSLAAALHPDIAAAYDAAQDRAAGQIIAWLSAHASTRIGPRGGQVQVPLQVLEAVTIRHYTSRAGDPHRHLHMQINARVFAAGKWRGLHTVGVRDSLGALNGIGHAAMACDPELNAAFAAHGYTRTGTGELRQLADYVGPMSARAAQIEAAMNGYEREWTAAHPGDVPGPGLRRTWHARAWAKDRPDKVRPQPGVNLDDRWRTELHDLGYRDPPASVARPAVPVGELDRDDLARRTLTRLAAARSAWNAADVRGEVEQLIAAAGVVADSAVRTELAEDLTARALERCVPLLDRDGLPEHLRALTSRPVLAVEADLTVRLAARTTDVGVAQLALLAEVARRFARLDARQAAAAAALAGGRGLLVIEGAAGAGKTTTLAAARELLARQGRVLVVVTPTLKAAKVVQAEIGAAASSAARLAHQHGWRWNTDGAWARLVPGQLDPTTGRPYDGPEERARLRPGDLLVVDEAGMLDQDTARALLTVADESGARVALVGDRHQLAAVGRGGVLDLALAHVAPDAHVTLESVHRFVRADETGQAVPDTSYAELTLAMRAGQDPGGVFDTLLARGQVRLHPDTGSLQEALADAAAVSYATGEPAALVVDTGEQAAALNAAVRERMIQAGYVGDGRVVVTGAGSRISRGDLIATRRNDPTLGVANRDLWFVTAVDRSGGLQVTPAQGAPVAGMSPPQRALPAHYVTAHVELAYAMTAHGAQGGTVQVSHLLLGEHTGAAAAYVGMTRGRWANTAHLVADTIPEAREQWLAVFARDGADLGPGHAARLAAVEAARYAPARPLEVALSELRTAWTLERRCLDRLAAGAPARDALVQVIALDAASADERERLGRAWRQACDTAETARQRATLADAAVVAATDRARDRLRATWTDDRELAGQAARIWAEGPGRFGRHRPAMEKAAGELTAWADRWRPLLPALPTDPAALARLATGYITPAGLWAALEHAADTAGRAAHPEHAPAHAAADAARAAEQQAWRDRSEASDRYWEAKRPYGVAGLVSDPAASLAALDRDLADTRQALTDARARIATLSAEPALLAQPPGRLTAERATWQAQHVAAERVAAARAAADRAREQSMTPDPDDQTPPLPGYGYHHPHMHMHGPHHGGPSIGI